MKSHTLRLGLGLVLMGFGWPLAWLRPAAVPLLWENSFFILWLGYSLAVDGFNGLSSGSSLYTRSSKGYVGLFLLSIPCWWIFEFFNLFMQNWFYIQNRFVGDVEYAIRASIAFSTVTPAVLGTAEAWSRLPLFARLNRNDPHIWPARSQADILLLGVLMLLAVIAFPRYAFYLVWLGLYLLIDVLNLIRGNDAILRNTQLGRWRPFVTLPLAGLTCGLMWEFWNFYSLPKWVYRVPWVDFAHIFEMPALGYLGYLPFGLEVAALYIFLSQLTGWRKTGLIGQADFLRF
jgi:hypothetical protein